MSQTQISPLSAAQHYSASASFWEERAKLLQHLYDEAAARAATAEARVAELEAAQTAPAPAKAK
jgi:hypothetical protein